MVPPPTPAPPHIPTPPPQLPSANAPCAEVIVASTAPDYADYVLACAQLPVAEMVRKQTLVREYPQALAPPDGPTVALAPILPVALPISSAPVSSGSTVEFEEGKVAALARNRGKKKQ